MMMLQAAVASISPHADVLVVLSSIPIPLTKSYQKTSGFHERTGKELTTIFGFGLNLIIKLSLSCKMS
jgi:hypothetical protein